MDGIIQGHAYAVLAVQEVLLPAAASAARGAVGAGSGIGAGVDLGASVLGGDMEPYRMVKVIAWFDLK